MDIYIIYNPIFVWDKNKINKKKYYGGFINENARSL